MSPMAASMGSSSAGVDLAGVDEIEPRLGVAADLVDAGRRTSLSPRIADGVAQMKVNSRSASRREIGPLYAFSRSG